MSSVQEINEAVAKQMPVILEVVEEMGKVMVGQKDLIQKLFIGLLADGHILVEGVPGLAKTTAIKTLRILSMPSSAGFSSRRIFCPRIWWAPRFIRRRMAAFRSSRDRYSRISCWPTRSTGRRRKYKVHCWKRCRSGR